jgi:hypothetical protein
VASDGEVVHVSFAAYDFVTGGRQSINPYPDINNVANPLDDTLAIDTVMACWQ